MESSTETDDYTYLVLLYNTANVTNQLTVDAVSNDYSNEKVKQFQYHTIYMSSYRWIENIN